MEADKKLSEMELDMVADMEMDMVTDMKVDKAVDKVVNMVANIVADNFFLQKSTSTSTSKWKSNLVRELVTGVG